MASAKYEDEAHDPARGPRQRRLNINLCRFINTLSAAGIVLTPLKPTTGRDASALLVPLGNHIGQPYWAETYQIAV